jgi:hypothetical protein
MTRHTLSETSLASYVRIREDTRGYARIREDTSVGSQSLINSTSRVTRADRLVLVTGLGLFRPSTGLWPRHASPLTNADGEESRGTLIAAAGARRVLPGTLLPMNKRANISELKWLRAFLATDLAGPYLAIPTSSSLLYYRGDLVPYNSRLLIKMGPSPYLHAYLVLSPNFGCVGM